MTEKDTTVVTPKQETTVSAPPSGLKILWRELMQDKVAMVALALIIIIFIGLYVGALFINQGQLTSVDISRGYLQPFQDGALLGTDDGGRDIFQLMIVGGRNSVTIGLAVTIIIEFIGLAVGLVAGYFGGMLDNIIMRVVDFIMILPTLPILMVISAIVSQYNMIILITMLCIFNWTGTARYFRSFVLSQRERDYVLAAKTSGASHLRIMVNEILPNISSMIIVDMTLMLAGNIGIETTLSYLGFGLPQSTPSLGTLIAYANDPTNIVSRPWLWLPATALLLIISLSVSYVGRAVQRAADARQRRG